MNRTKVFALGLAFILLLSLFVSMYAEKNMKSQQDTNTAIAKGVIYLSSIQDNASVFKDAYLSYVYSSENLSCIDDCPMTYRKMDAYFDLVFLEQSGFSDPTLDPLIQKADTTLRSLLPLWEQGKLYNIANQEKKEKNGFALDTFCILGFIYNDSAMAETVLESRTENNWLLPDAYTHEDVWRQIADESWCVMLLAKTHAPNEDVLPFAEQKKEETKKFLASNATSEEKAAVVMHALLMFHTLEENNYEVKYPKKEWQVFLVETSPSFLDNTLLLANALETLENTDYQDRKQMNAWAALLLGRQSENGAWYPYVDQTEDNGQAFTTMRVIVALENYSYE